MENISLNYYCCNIKKVSSLYSKELTSKNNCSMKNKYYSLWVYGLE
ncbi:hypothetical protein BCF50_1910 [Chryseobacterium daecheongense]|uniref:Uncharacterized protein n=1 Tax=Chryseobacterium daecheongense TaxID=192389 RepID=A0ABY2FWT2_9FLAO|nr:hypothetical protein BCF50_1910 [Chryseobacterium daecheongense]